MTLLFILLSGCALPEGKLIVPASKDAGPKLRDAGVIHADSAVASGDANDVGRGGTGAAESSTPAATGGAKSEPDTRAPKDAGSSAALDPQANGETCAESSECASDNCKSGPDGRRCYGLVALDKACSGAYDCDGYSCIPATSTGMAGVCVDTSTCTTRDRCAQDYWAATCHLDQLCSAQPSSFNQCYRKACTRPRDSNDLCLSELAVAKELIASRCCPPAGAYHSSCDPAPQCGCKDGDKCDVVGNDGQTSCGKAGSLPELGECKEHSDCTVGSVCTAIDGVAVAHKNGVIHRDLKPDNIFLARSRSSGSVSAKVLDFGVAKLTTSSGPTLTETGMTMGTPVYMSLEQLRGDRDVDARADVYAFGAMLYEAMAGVTPFHGDTLHELVFKVATTLPRPLKELRPDLPTPLARLVDWAIARDREQRVPDLRALIRELEPFAQDRGFG